MCIRHRKILTSQKLSGPFGLSDLKSFHGFLILGRRMVSIAYLLFYLAIKLLEVLVWKIFTKNHIENGQGQLKRSKTPKCSKADIQKDKILIIWLTDQYRGKEFPINKLIDSIHKKALRRQWSYSSHFRHPETVWASKYSIERS